MKYDVYFEIYGKKLKTTVEAVNEEYAKEIVRQKIVFHKVVKDESWNHSKDVFSNIMDIVNGK